MKHKHRIKPGYEGGEYVEGNVVSLSVTQHAMWHFAEWQRKGNWEDKLAWQALAGIVGREEITQTLPSEAGKKGGKSIVSDEEFRQKMSKANTGKTRTPEQIRHCTCVQCGVDTFIDNRDYYMLTNELWDCVGVGEDMLCMACVEERLGRPVEAEDLLDCPLNTWLNNYTKKILQQA